MEKDYVKMVVNSYTFLAFLIIIGLLNILMFSIFNVIMGLIAVVYGSYLVKRKISAKEPADKIEVGNANG